MNQTPAFIYRLVSHAEWQTAQAAGTFHGSAHDQRDGFIHFSTASQLRETAAKHYAGRSDLLLLRVAVAELSAPLRWEVSRNQELFPHLYGRLEVSAVSGVDAVPLGADSTHQFDALLPE
jgi:uncharacterized protein (DUF952 family)